MRGRAAAGGPGSSEERSHMPLSPAGKFSRSLERGLAILASFGPDRLVRGIAEVADELGISRSTTHRYMSTLSALGYLEQDASRRYRLGSRAADLGLSTLDCTGLRKDARAFLEELRARTRHTVVLAVLNREHVLLIDVARGYRRGQHQIDALFAAGIQLPAYCTAFGKLLLAYLPEHEQRNLIAKTKLSKRGLNTITSKKNLRDELECIRRDGLALSDEELGPDLISIAASVRDASGGVNAALGIAALGSMGSAQDLLDQTAKDLTATAGELSRLLAGRPKSPETISTRLVEKASDRR
jgi:IclR family transcriptional regulator, pca regulon regulatory protein